MEKKITCGMLVCSEHGFLALLPTGRKDEPGNYDIAKGCKEEGEGVYTTAERELKEETGLDMKYLMHNTDVSIHSFGINPYLKEKDLYLFVVEINDIDKFFDFKCSSFFETENGVELPEMKDYKWVRSIEYYFKSLRKCFNNLRQNNNEFDEILKKYEND